MGNDTKMVIVGGDSRDRKKASTRCLPLASFGAAPRTRGGVEDGFGGIKSSTIVLAAVVSA